VSYLHIDNLYKPDAQTILLLRECYALEKIHGTSAHVKFKAGMVSVFSGGANHAEFAKLFEPASEMAGKFNTADLSDCIVYGEAYGGKMQGMRDTYGPDLRFVVFDVNIGGKWLNVPDAEQVAHSLGLEFVHYRRISTDLASLDAERDLPSVQAARNGIEKPMPREGIDLRPIIEVVKNNGQRIIAKHKAEYFRETKTARPVDASQLAVLTGASAIAQEWVTRMRLSHVIDRLGGEIGPERIPDIIHAMLEDVEREGDGEIVMDKAARKAISSRTVSMFKAWLQEQIGREDGGR